MSLGKSTAGKDQKMISIVLGIYVPVNTSHILHSKDSPDI